MSRVFDPNTNPYADDLLRLALAPPSRFSKQERRAMGSILAGKLYGLGISTRSWYFLDHDEAHFLGSDVWGIVAIVLIFDDENDEWTLERMLRRLGYRKAADQMIVLSVGAAGVIEIYNGPWITAVSSIRNASNSIWNADDAPRYPTEGDIPAGSDAELSRDYLGQDRGGGGEGDDGRGGDGGGNDGVPPGGEGGSSGAGGVGELLNHPVLFSIERRHFDAILRQV